MITRNRQTPEACELLEVHLVIRPDMGFTGWNRGVTPSKIRPMEKE